MPDLEQMIPGLEPVMPGLKQVMPGLEWMCSRERPAMQKQPLLSSLEERVKQTGVEIPAIFVTNFRNTFTEVSNRVLKRQSNGAGVCQFFSGT